MGTTLNLQLNDWGTLEEIGKGYAFTKEGRFYPGLEAKAGSYWGNHIHPNKQYTLFLSGKASYVPVEDGVETTIPLDQE